MQVFVMIKLCNSNKYRCECKELIDTGKCDDGFVWNPSICECECDKLFDAGEYLNYANLSPEKGLLTS